MKYVSSKFLQTFEDLLHASVFRPGGHSDTIPKYGAANFGSPKINRYFGIVIFQHNIQKILKIPLDVLPLEFDL